MTISQARSSWPSSGAPTSAASSRPASTWRSTEHRAVGEQHPPVATVRALGAHEAVCDCGQRGGPAKAHRRQNRRRLVLKPCAAPHATAGSQELSAAEGQNHKRNFPRTHPRCPLLCVWWLKSCCSFDRTASALHIARFSARRCLLRLRSDSRSRGTHSRRRAAAARVLYCVVCYDAAR